MQDVAHWINKMNRIMQTCYLVSHVRKLLFIKGKRGRELQKVEGRHYDIYVKEMFTIDNKNDFMQDDSIS